MPTLHAAPRVTALVAAVACIFFTAGEPLAEEPPPYLKDRGPGIATSMFGTYVQKGELLLYPFVEVYNDADFEYKPSELGYSQDTDYRGRYGATEFLLFLGYGISDALAFEFETAVISAELEKSPKDPSAVPEEVEEAGLGDVEGQLRWRFLKETTGRPEAFTYFETVFPIQKTQKLIGTADWEFKLGVGFVKGFSWGTGTFRLSTEYNMEESKMDAGEYAFEYLKRLSRHWRVVGVLEGVQLDEVSLITEIQWHFARRAFLKLNNGWGLTPNATDYAPEMGVMISF